MNKQKKSQTSLFYLFLIVCVAAALRFFLFRYGEVISSSDEILLYEYSLKPVYAFYTGDTVVAITELFRFFNFAWGWGTILFSTGYVLFLSIVGISLTEWTINFPYILVGIATVFLSYYVAKEFMHVEYALLVSFLIAVMPSHVAYSRTIGVNGVVGLFFFLLALLLFIRYCKTGKKKFIVGAYILFGFYFVSDNQGLGIIPLLLYVSYIYCKDKKVIPRIVSSIKRCVSWKGILVLCMFLLPTIAGAVYLWTQDLIKSSYLNLFHSKPFVPSFYIEETLASVAANGGIVLTLFLVIGLLLYLVLLSVRKVSRESTILFVWFLVYSVPWLFLVPPESVDLRVYNTYTIISLLFIGTYALSALGKHCDHTKKYSVFILCIVFIVGGSNVLVIAESVYGYGVPFIEQSRQVFGAVGENTGMKTIGFYVRQNLPENSKIFVDAESFVGTYYFARPVIGGLDLEQEEIKELLKNIPEEGVSYVFLRVENADFMKEVLAEKGFVPLVYAAQGNEVKGVLYTKEQVLSKETPSIMNVEKYDSLFDERYGNIHSLFIDFG